MSSNNEKDFKEFIYELLEEILQSFDEESQQIIMDDGDAFAYIWTVKEGCEKFITEHGYSDLQGRIDKLKANIKAENVEEEEEDDE